MTQKDLSSLFPESCRIGNLILLVSPELFYKLEGLTITGSRMFMMLCQGHMTLTLNDRPYELGAHSYFDIMETATARIDSTSPDLRGWCLFVSFEFASESLKNLRPGPLHYSLEHPNIRIWHFSPSEIDGLELQLNLLKETIANPSHYYRRELASVYFKSFSLELGNCMLSHQENPNDIPPYVSKRDFITLNFMTLVSKHFAEEHHIEFYANALCISTKHLTRVVREMVGKTPHAVICDEITHQAMTLLEDDRISIGQIAERLHFSDQASFCKFFKKQKQISPMAYRRQNKTGIE